MSPGTLNQMIDPGISSTFAIGVGALVLVSGAHKFLGNENFVNALASYRLLPQRLTTVVARLVPTVEIGAGAASMFVGTAVGRAGLLACCILLVSYAVLILATLARGIQDIDCGCMVFGARRRRLAPAMVVRNLFMATIGLIGLLPSTGRQMIWLDGVFVVTALCASGLLYVASDLIIGQPRRGV